MRKALPLLVSYLCGASLLLACEPIKAPALDGGAGSATDGGVGIDAAANSALCGNGQPDPGESCDDGNKNAGDGCSTVCLNEGDFCSPGRVGNIHFIGALGGRMVAEGNLVYLAGHRSVGNPFFRVLNVSDPSSVGEESFFRHTAYPSSRTHGLIKRGNLVWLAGQDPGITALKVDNPMQVSLGDSRLNPASDGHLARLGENHLLVSQSVSDRPAIYDISTGTPVFVGVLGDSGDEYYNVGSSGTHAFASTFSNSIDVYDSASNPAGAQVVGRYVHAVAWNSTSAVEKIVAEGNLVAVAVKGSAGGVHLIDVGIPSAPVFKATIDEQVDDLALVGRYLFVPGVDGLRVYDVLDPGNPTPAGSIVDFSFDASSVAISGNRAYAVAEDKMMIVEGLPGICQARCGNTQREYPELCDDGNLDDGDGCSADCLGN